MGQGKGGNRYRLVDQVGDDDTGLIAVMTLNVPLILTLSGACIFSLYALIHIFSFEA